METGKQYEIAKTPLEYIQEHPEGTQHLLALGLIREVPPPEPDLLVVLHDARGHLLNGSPPREGLIGDLSALIRAQERAKVRSEEFEALLERAAREGEEDGE